MKEGHPFNPPSQIFPEFLPWMQPIKTRKNAKFHLLTLLVPRISRFEFWALINPILDLAAIIGFHGFLKS